MALVDSEAAFSAHCDKISGSGQVKKLMHDNNLQKFSQLAFVCGIPQSPSSKLEFTAFCVNINGGVNLSLLKTSEVRRLHFESSTMVVANLKSQVSSETQDGVRKLPIAEKQARLISISQQSRLQGVAISGELKPSHACIDLVASVVENHSVIWISPSRCSKREGEIQNITKEKSSTVYCRASCLEVRWQHRQLMWRRIPLRNFNFSGR